MRASSGVSSLSEGFQTRSRTVAGVVVTTPVPKSHGLRIGVISSLIIIGASIGVGWIIGSGRLPVVIAAIKAMLS